MNVQLTNEQLQILLDNDGFRSELVSSLVSEITKNPSYNYNYSKLLDVIKCDVTKGLIRTSLAQDAEFKIKVDEKVEQTIEKFVSRSIGKVVLKSLQEENCK